MRWKSLFHVGLDGGHEVEADAVSHGGSSETVLVDGAKGNIGSGSGEAEAESPAGLGNLFSTFVSTLLKLVLTSTGLLALGILIGAILLNAGNDSNSCPEIIYSIPIKLA